jgi:hypothetical protein
MADQAVLVIVDFHCPFPGDSNSKPVGLKLAFQPNSSLTDYPTLNWRILKGISAL